MKKQLKNIIIVNDYNYTQGGASKVAIETANLLSNDKNYNVYFFSGCTNDKSELKDSVIDVCYNQRENLEDKNRIKGSFRGIYNFKAKKEFKKLLSTLDPTETIIHVHGWTKVLSSSIFKVAKKKHFNFVLTLHDYFSICPNGACFNYNKNCNCGKRPMSFKCFTCNCDSRNWFYKYYRYIRQLVQNRMFRKYVKDVITISNFQEKILMNYLPKDISSTRINNPIDLDLVNTKIDISKNDYYIFVGRLTRGKGVDVFCDAISSLKLKGVVVGSGEKLDEMKEK